MKRRLNYMAVDCTCTVRQCHPNSTKARTYQYISRSVVSIRSNYLWWI